LAFFFARSLRFTVRFDIGDNVSGWKVTDAKRGELWNRAGYWVTAT